MNRQNRFQKISLALAVSLVFSGCGAAAEETVQEQSSAIAVKAVAAEVGTLAVSNQFIGTVSPQQQVSIMPLVSGEVDAVYAEVGDEVQAGDVLFHIKDDAARLQKESAEVSRQSAELSAQMQLGSGQVMNNISMESNIRSLEYQLEMAQDQYQSAVDGIVDATEAKSQMGDAIDEMNHSVNELQRSQKRMEEVISRAEKYVEPANPLNLLSGEYKYKVEYNYRNTPDHYQWGQNGSAAPGTTNGSGILNLPNAGDDSQIRPTNPSSPDQAETEAPSDPTESSEQESEEENVPDTNPDEEGNGTGTAQTPDNTEDDTQSGNSEDEKTQDTNTNETNAGTGAQDSDAEGDGTQDKNVMDETASAIEEEMAGVENSTLYAYFSVELIKEDIPLYLADNDGTIPKLEDTTLEKAWEAYYRQQEIDAAAHDAKEMGYSADDIGSGKARTELMEKSVKIAAMQYQISQLESNQASMEGSIKSAESARDTTEKSIDFYEDNLESAQVTYGISNGQAYQDTAGMLASQIQAADVGVRSAQLQLEYYSPTTPISGTVVSKTVEQFGLVQPGYAAYVISNQDAMNVTFTVSGQVRDNLQIGMPVTLEKNGSTYSGTITEIGEAVEQQSGGLFVVKAITEADGGKLAGGTSVKLTLDTFRSENTILIPYDAIHFESEQAYVFEIVDEKAVKKSVTVGLMSEDMVEVTEGLSAGSRVVATWSSQLEDGAAVRIIGESKTEDDGEAGE